jgi:ankyrin repeat protein
MSACVSKRIDLVKKLVSKGVMIDAVAEDGASALHHACRISQNDEIIEYLLQAEADTNLQSYEQGNTALMEAIIHKHRENALSLLRLNKEDMSISKGDPMNVNACDDLGECALFHAVRVPDEEMVIELLAVDANINIVNNVGDSLLHVAVMACVGLTRGTQGLDIVKLLIERNCDFKRNKSNKSALQLAVSGQLYEITEAFLKAKAHVFELNRQNEVNLYHLCAGNSDEALMMQSLLKRHNVKQPGDVPACRCVIS